MDAKAAKFSCNEVKIDRPHLSGDRKGLQAVREGVSQAYEGKVDVNLSFNLAEATRRVAMLQSLGVAWLEEPVIAKDVEAHRELAVNSPVPVAVGECMNSINQFKSYPDAEATSIVQVDDARTGGITRCMKAAHMAEAHDAPCVTTS